ncbi:MAG: filamentous hemagglutinin N-terminal domain-containing protein [Cyanobacteria bacterium P01_A01_bin.114]
MLFPVTFSKSFCLNAFLLGFGVVSAALGLTSAVYGQIASDSASPTNSLVTSTDATNFAVDGGTFVGSNQLHRFSSFSVPADGSVTFDGTSVDNILNLVTGNSVSEIDGAIRVSGTADFFLINPNGIVFGPKASLDIGGSFLVSTAEEVLFSNGEQFSATQTPLNSALLSINIPVGLQFGNSAGQIVNRSNAFPTGAVGSRGSAAGLSVQSNQSITFIGNGLHFEGGNLTAPAGHIELGSVVPDSNVYLGLTEQGWMLNYADGQRFRDIHLSQASILDVSGTGGSFNATGLNIAIASGSRILNLTSGSITAGDTTLKASDSIEFLDNLSGIFFPVLLNTTGNGSDLTIETQRLILQDGAVISGGTAGTGQGGALLINASESVVLEGTGIRTPTLITSSTDGPSDGGDLTINTANLIVRNGAQIQAATFGPGEGGTIAINASDFVELSGTGSTLVESEIPSGLFASSRLGRIPIMPTGNGGDVQVITRELTLRDGAQVAVNSIATGNAGNLTIDANRISLDNQAQITAAAASGNGGNISLQNIDALLLRDNSLISTTAGSGNGEGNGGNIDIDARFIITLPNGDTDIIANAIQGQGGNITINSSGLLGIASRPAIPGNGTNDIDASSEFGFDGAVAIEQPLPDESQVFVELTNGPIEPSSLVVSQCGDLNNNQFVLTGRGGIPINPSEISEAETPLVDLGTSDLLGETYAPEGEAYTLPEVTNTHPLIEAQGWYTDETGHIVLTADIRDASSRIAALPYASCHGRLG